MREREGEGKVLLVALVLLALIGQPAQAQEASTGPTTKTMRAMRTTTPVVVDGSLDEDAWRGADAIDDLVQQEPNVGQPVSERTEVRVLYDDEALYFGIVCDESRPDGVTARELRRDNAFANDDRFEIVLDTFLDHRNGYHFVINPLGTQYDAQITDEGLDNNIEWDERWWSETRITDRGWTAEIKIPFTTLRSAKGLETFGVNFKRFIRSKNETAQWTGWDRDFAFLQVSQAGQLVGLQGIETGLKLRIKPYALGGARDETQGADADLARVSEVGLEVVKFSLTPGLTAEITVNTDFAQTEVDDAVVNLTRFPVFFPEKREFFLERAGIFEFGPGGRRGGVAERNLQMFFSRRIGLTEDRQPVQIFGGGKVVGRAGGLDLGVLNVQTDRFEDTPGSNYSVVRAKRNVLARSNVGMFLSNRQSSGDEYNRVMGADATFTILKNTDISGFLAKSWTPGKTGDDYAGRAKYNWFSDLYEVYFEHIYVGPDFQHDVGFVRRTDVQRSDTAFIWEPRPGVLDIRNLVMRGEVIYTTDTRQRLLTREQIFAFTSRWQSDDVARFSLLDTFDRLDRPFEIAPGVIIPTGDYHFSEQWVELEGSGKRALSGRVRYGRGDFYSGRRQFVQTGPSFKPFPLMSLETSYEFNDVELREGAFTTHVVNARVNLNLSNRWLTTTIAQYDSASKRDLLFFRLNYIHRPGDDLFVVITRSNDRGLIRSRPDYAVLVKFTYSFDY